METHTISSYAARLLVDLTDIEARFVRILEQSTLERHSTPPNPYASLASHDHIQDRISFRWAPLDPLLEEEQSRLQARYESWFSEFNGLLRYTTKDRYTRIARAHNDLSNWLKHRSSGSIPPSPGAAIAAFRTSLASFSDELQALDAASRATIFAIPDTNIILDFPDITSFVGPLHMPINEVLLVPTVLAELDGFKTSRANAGTQAAARTALRAINEIKDRGNPLVGIPLISSVTLRMVPAEPKFE